MGEVTVTVKAANAVESMLLLRDDPELRFEQVIDVCGMDYKTYGDGRWEGARFAAVYHLLSVSRNNRLRVRVFAPDDDMPLLYALRDNLGLHGPKFGCGLAQCGTCTVLVDGKAVRSCVTPTSSVAGKSIRTLDGLARGDQLHPVQEAFVHEQAAQCGYCANGWIMHTVALLEKTPKPTEAMIKQAFTNLQCRCGSHMAIMRAVKRASGNVTPESKA